MVTYEQTKWGYWVTVEDLGGQFLRRGETPNGILMYQSKGVHSGDLLSGAMSLYCYDIWMQEDELKY